MLKLNKIALAVAIAATLSACGSNDDKHGGTTVSTTTIKATAVGKAPTSLSVSAIEQEKRSQLSDKINENELKAMQYTLNVNGKAYKSGETVNFADHLPKNQVGEATIQHDFRSNTGISAPNNVLQQSVTINQTLRGYRQDYSMVAGSQTTGISSKNLPQIGQSDERSETNVDIIKGHLTPETALPKTGTYNYTGKAFTTTEASGILNYNVDFDKQVGSGKISGLTRTGDMNLDEGKIGSFSHTNDSFDDSTLSGVGISSTASKSTVDASGNVTKTQVGNYNLGFFGNTGEEISGIVTRTDGNDVGFGGKR